MINDSFKVPGNVSLKQYVNPERETPIHDAAIFNDHLGKSRLLTGERLQVKNRLTCSFHFPSWPIKFSGIYCPVTLRSFIVLRRDLSDGRRITCWLLLLMRRLYLAASLEHLWEGEETPRPLTANKLHGGYCYARSSNRGWRKIICT